MIVPPHVLAAIRQPAFVYRREGIVEAANDRAEDWAGRPLAGMTLADIVACLSVRHRDGTLIPPSDLPSARALRGEGVVDLPLTITAADGRTVHILATASPLPGDGMPAGALSIWQDVTTLVEAEERGQRQREELQVQNEELRVQQEELRVQEEMLRCQADELRAQSTALRTSLERLAFGQRAAQTGFWDWDMLTDRLEWSPEFYDLFGLDPAAPASFETWLGVMHPDDHGLAMATLDRSVRERTRLENQYRVVLPGGAIRWIGAYGDSTYDAVGTPVRMAGICIDITGRKETEAALRESEARERVAGAVAAERQRLFGVLEALPVMICLLTMDRHVAFANRVYREMFGATEGRHCHEMNFGFSEPCPFCEAYGVLETGRPHQWECVTPAGRTIEVFNAPFADVDGTPLVLEMDIDVTDQRQAEAALREANLALDERVRVRTADLEDANARLRDEIDVRQAAEAALRETRDYLDNLIDHANAPIIVWDPAFRITRFNAAFEHLSGYAADEVIGRDLAILFPGESREASLAKIQRTITERWESVEIPILRPDGGVRIALWNSANIHDTAGTLLATIAQGQDITERKEAEEALRSHAESLRRSNEDLERFAYVASHDLQEPLRSIVSFTQLLDRRYKGRLDAEADEFIDFIVEGGTRMQGLILDLLAFSRVNTTRQQIARTDAEAVLAEAERSLDAPLREAEASLTHDPLPVVMADPTQLAQVFSNLVSNAIKFRKPDVPLRIHIGAQRLDGVWEFSVRDNGIGIEREYFEKIFVIFQRLHTKDAYPGTGIGLAIVKRIIERHGGTIRVESTPGEGSTFFFTLPAA